MTVLVVDDERRSRERLARLLRGVADIQVVGEAAGGTAALEAIASLQPHAVFLDVRMPGMTGFDVVAALPTDQRPWVVFVTAYDQHALEAFVADQALVFAVTASGRFLVEVTLRALEERLDAERFARVHKQTIVNLGHLHELTPVATGGAAARLRSGHVIEISRRYAPSLRRLLHW
jgi:two-component system LytT family response regulator